METGVSDGFIWSRWAAEDSLVTSSGCGITSTRVSNAAWQKHLAEALASFDYLREAKHVHNGVVPVALRNEASVNQIR